jgi:hypothetical protein
MMQETGEAIDSGNPAVDGLSADPAAIVDQAVQDGVAAPTREKRVTPSDVSDLVKTWWDRTAATAEFSQAVDQAEMDLETLDGGTADELEDDAEITVQHVYRNAMQAVSMMVPATAGIEWKPRSEVKPLPGTPIPPEVIQRRRQQQGLASVVTTLVQRFGEMGNFQEKIEAFVQDSIHFPAAVLKVWFQRDIGSDPASASRLPDEQDLIQKTRVLVEQYDRGDFGKSEAQYAELRQCLAAIGRTEQEIRRGIVLELRPLSNYRCDPAVEGPEYIDNAAWESDDVLLTRDQWLANYPELCEDDLSMAMVYQVDAIGRAVRQEREAKVTNAHTINQDRPSAGFKPVGSDYLLGREIYDYHTNTRLLLLEGVDFPLVEEPLDRSPIGMSPFVILVENRRPRRLYGYSDTQMQAKTQRQLNRLRSQEEDSRRRAEPRWGVDASLSPNGDDLKKAMMADPGSITPIRTQCKPGEFEKSFINLAGNGQHNANDFQIAKGALTQELRKMASLPEAASGELGQAKFSSEVQAAANGANALAKYRQTRIIRALKRLFDKIAQLILLNVNQDLAVRLAGPMAAEYYPPQPMTRQEIYDGLTISVEVELDKQLDYARRADALAKLIDAFAKSGVQFDKEIAARLLGKFTGLGEESEDLVQSDPNDLIGRLMAAMQKDPQGLAPEAIMALAQMGTQAQQMAQQMAMQQAQQAAQQQQQGAPAAPGAPYGSP